MDPDTPPRSRRSSILKVTRPPPPRSPLQSLEANQDAQDEDRTTVTRSFKRRVSFSRTNKVQEFCLENPQKWGEAYEKELSPEPSSLLQRGPMAALPLETTSSLQELLSSEIKSAPTFSLGSSVLRTSFVEVTHTSSMHVMSLPATVTSGALASTEDSDDDMDITSPNATVPPIAPVPQLHLCMDKENLQTATKVLPDFLHRSFNDKSNLSAMLMDTTGAFPSNVNLEPDDYDLSPKRMCTQNVLNQTRIEDSAMEMSTCSVTDDGNNEMNTTLGKPVDFANKSFKLFDKTMSESINMDMTENFTRPSVFGSMNASIYAPNKTLNTSALDITRTESPQLNSQETIDNVEQQQNENDPTLSHAAGDNMMEMTIGFLSHTNKSINSRENSAMETTGIASKTLEKSTMDTTCNSITTGIASKTLEKSTMDTTCNTGENTLQLSSISDMMLTKLADTTNLSSMKTSFTYKAGDTTKNTSNESMNMTSVGKTSQTFLDMSNIMPQTSQLSIRLEKGSGMNKTLNDNSVMDITKSVNLNETCTNQTVMSETITKEPSTNNTSTTSEQIYKFFGPQGLPLVDNIEFVPPTSHEIETENQSFEMDITEVSKPIDDSTASRKLNQTFTKPSLDATVNSQNESLPQHIEIKETVVTKTSSPKFNKTINYEKSKVTDKLENQTCEVEICEVVETFKETCVSPTAQTEVQVTRVHVTEDLEDLQINDKTGEISRKVKHMEIRETIESSSPVRDELEIEPESQGTKVELNSRQELYLSPVSANQSADVATLITRPNSRSSSKKSSPLQVLPKRIQFTENSSPKKKSSNKDEYKRSSDSLEEEPTPRKKSCQMEQASTSKARDVPEIVIINATPTESEIFVLPSPRVETASKLTGNSNQGEPQSADMSIIDSDMEIDLSQTKTGPKSTSSSMELDSSQTSNESEILSSGGSSDVFIEDVLVEIGISKTLTTKPLDETKVSEHVENKQEKHRKKSQGPEKSAKKVCIREQPDAEMEDKSQPEVVPAKPTRPLTAEEQIREDIKSMKSVWRVHSLRGLQWQFSTLRGSMLLNLHLTGDWKIGKADFVLNPAGIPSQGKSSRLAWEFCQSLLLARFPAASLAELCAPGPSVLAFLKQLQPTLDSLTALIQSLDYISSFHLIEFSGTTMKFNARSLRMLLLLNVSIDLAHWETLSSEKVSVNVVHGSLKEDEIMEMMPNVPSNGELLPKFMAEMLEYVRMLEKFSVNVFNQSICAEH